MSKQNKLTNIKIVAALKFHFLKIKWKFTCRDMTCDLDMSSDLDQMSSPWLVHRTRTVLYSSLWMHKPNMIL